MKRTSKHICLVIVATCAAIFTGLCAMSASAAPSQQKTTTKTVTKSEKKTSQSRTGAVRTLDAINIEGEIAVPQVLFITSRDYPRYRDGLRFEFRKSKLEVARSLDLPARLRIVAQPKTNKEEGP